MLLFVKRPGIGRAARILAAVAVSAGFPIGATSAAAIGVLTKAEPGLSSAGTAIWHCTYVAGNRETTVIFKTACPASVNVE